jgi:hypothetical protein
LSFFKRFTKPKSDVSLTIPKHTVELGEELKGAIAVSVEDEFDATEVRAELRCVARRRREKLEYNRRLKRNVQRVYWDHAILHSADPKASSKLHLVPGFKRTFPFSVSIPAGGRESFDGLDANVTWSIKGVVAIDGRPDVTSETIELQVIKPAGAPMALREKEVVMVACQYCTSLMPETATSCPNCGAPRKA